MISLRYYLDSRATEGEAPLKLMLTRRGESALLKVGISLLPEQWDKKAQKVIKHPHAKGINDTLLRFRFSVQDYLSPLLCEGVLADMPITDIKRLVDEHFNGKRYTTPFSLMVDELAAEAKRRGTKATIIFASGVVSRYCKERVPPVERMTAQWCRDFFTWVGENYASGTYNIIHARMSQLFTRAIKAKRIRVHPMEEIKKKQLSSRSRALTLEQLRKVWSYPTKRKGEEIALDLFRFSFLCRAANLADIRELTKENIYNGRLEYDRRKTGKHYSVKIEPELQALIDKYCDGVYLFPPLREYATHISASSSLDKHLKKIGSALGLSAPLTTYWARHTYATLLMEMGVSVDLISAALGHSIGAKITMTYVAVSSKQVDDASRALLDWVLYDRRECQ